MAGNMLSFVELRSAKQDKLLFIEITQFFVLRTLGSISSVKVFAEDALVTAPGFALGLAHSGKVLTFGGPAN